MLLTIDATRKTKPLGDLFGLFFEDLNHAADGGLYTELVQNRSFEFSALDNPEYHALTGWKALGTASLRVESTAPCFPENPHYLVLEAKKPGDGVENMGFGAGMYFEAGQAYRLRFWAAAERACELIVSLACAGLPPLAEARIECSGNWQCYEAMLMPEQTCTCGALQITCDGACSVRLDHVSLMPDQPYPFRQDILQAFQDMRPKFLRFPGGCLVHDGALDASDRCSMYRWKNTIGPVERRPARRNNWRYNQSLGLGFYEYFVLSELLGAKPLPVLPGGCDPHHHRFAEGEQLQAFIQDALDLIEFANGHECTEWGAKRAAMGHPAPFGLEYIGIGNEEVHQEFYDRLPLFVSAIREKYPDIQIIGSAAAYAAGGEFERGWRSARETGVDLVDEHYYQSPEWYLANANRYMAYDATGPKVFLGEYASWGNAYENALVEAMYMIGLQNAPAVALACYAPLLCHVDYVNWQPDMIWFDNHRLLLTPNYHVQNLFMRHQGDQLLAIDIQGLETKMPKDQPIEGLVSLKSNDTVMLVSNIQLEVGGEVKGFPDATLEGQQQLALCATKSAGFALTLQAERLSGQKGMKIVFGERDADNMLSWGIGGWENQDSILDARVRGRGSCLTQQLFSVENGIKYELKLLVEGRRIRTYINGELYNDASDPLPAPESLYASASLDTGTGDIILKAVNVLDRPAQATIHLSGVDGPLAGEQYELSSLPLNAENTFTCPHTVIPRTHSFRAGASMFDHLFPAHSITIWRLHGEGAEAQ